MIDKILKILYASLALFTPLIMFRDTSELFEFNKILFIYLITIFVLFFWLLKMILYKKIILNKTLIFPLILLFFISQVLATAFSIDKQTSLFGYYGRFNAGLVSIIAYLILFFAYVSNFGSKFTYTLLKASLISSLLVILWGIPGKFGYDLSCYVFTGQLSTECWTDQFDPVARTFSTLGQPNWLGAYLALHFFIGFYFFLKTEQQSTKYFIFYILYLILNFTTILFTRSRSSLAAVIASFLLFPIIYLIFLYRSGVLSLKFDFIADLEIIPLATGKLVNTKFKDLVALFIKKYLFLSALLLFSIFIFRTGVDKIDRYFDLTFYQNSLNLNKQTATIVKQLTPQDLKFDKAYNKITPSSEIRKIVWLGAVDLAKKYPLFGTGVETFAYSYYFTRPLSHNLTSEWDYLYNKAHNEYLNYLATTGFVGLGAYMLLIGLVGIVFLKRILNSQFSIFNQFKNLKFKIKEEINQQLTINDQLLIVCLFLAYLTILITNFFGFSITVINLYFFLIPAIFFVLTKAENTAEIDKEKSRTNITFMQKVLISINSLGLLYFLIFIVSYFIADINYARAGNYNRIGEYDGAYQLLKGSLDLHYEHVYEDRLSNILANLSFVSASKKDIEKAKEQLNQAEFYNLRSLQASPYNVLYWKTRAKNYYLFYQITQDPASLKVGLEALEKAASVSPTDPKIPYTKALYYSLYVDEEKDEKKQELFQKSSLKELDLSLKMKPDYIDGYILKGQLLKKYNQKEEAKKAFQFILDNIDPNIEEVKKELDSL